MNTNGPSDQESVGVQPSIAHAVCHDCDILDNLFDATRPEDAKELALEAEIEHARRTEHKTSSAVVAEPTATATIGPDVADTEVVQR